MNENNYSLVYTDNEIETFENIIFIHSLIFNYVISNNGDIFDYDDIVTSMI